MSKDEIIRKLTSRKFWVALVAFVTALLTAFAVPDASITQITAIIMAFGSLIAYIFAEGWTDVASLSARAAEADKAAIEAEKAMGEELEEKA